MLKKNSSPLLFIFFLLNGCSSNEKYVQGIGLILVFWFLIFWFVSVFMPKIQELKIVSNFITKAKKPIIHISNAFIIVFAVLAIISTLRYEDINVLFGAIFGIGIVGLHYLKKWAKSIGSETSKTELKMFFMSITFIITLAWLIYSGSDHLR